MIEVNTKIIAKILENAWMSVTLEHYQEDEEFYALDFTNETD